MHVTSPTTEWPESFLSYGQMMSVRDVALALNIEESNVRRLLTTPDRNVRMPGVKLGTSWRVDRDQLRGYLIANHNDPAVSSTHQRGEL